MLGLGCNDQWVAHHGRNYTHSLLRPWLHLDGLASCWSAHDDRKPRVSWTIVIERRYMYGGWKEGLGEGMVLAFYMQVSILE